MLLDSRILDLCGNHYEPLWRANACLIQQSWTSLFSLDMVPSDIPPPGDFAEWYAFAFNPCNSLSLEASKLGGIRCDNNSGFETRSKRNLQNALWSGAAQDVMMLEVEGVSIQAPPASVVPHNSQLSQAFSRAARIVIVELQISTRGIL
jgi:hypothetical protein